MVKKLRNLVQFFKSHPFVALNALCVVVILLTVIGFGVLPTIFPEKTSITPEMIQSVERAPDRILNDPCFELILCKYLHCDVGELTETKLQKIQTLTIIDEPLLTDIQDLGRLIGLRKVKITGCGIQWIGDLSTLENLTEMDLSDNNIRTISSLKTARSLVKLNLSQNRISSIRDLTELPELIELDVSKNQIRDIEMLKYMAALETVNLSGNGIRTMPSISSYGLKNLDLANNQLRDLSFLHGDRELLSLNISYNNLSGIEELSSCRNLEELYLYGYGEMDLSPLESLPNFNSIYLEENFDRSKIDFLINHFKSADINTRIYLISKARDLDTNE